MKYKTLICGCIAAALSANTANAALDLYQPENNNTDKLVWLGHMSPDTDSVAAAMMAAHIYGGHATVAEDINPESQFVLDYCETTGPAVTIDYSDYQVGLVDFNQQPQLAPSVKPESIVAIIDHHAIGGSPINAAQLISMDIRAWGSTATILAANAEALDVELPPALACVGLGAILSDTVVFESATTTEYDRHFAAKLAQTAGIEDIEDFGQQMLVAKSDLSQLSADTILTLDYKNFEYAGKKVGIGVAETLTAQELIERKDELVQAMQKHKQASGLDYIFFSITDTKNKRANLLWVEQQEKQILEAAFASRIEADILSLDGVTSRKRQIGPAIQKAIESL